MFFTEKERLVYEYAGKLYDPLALDRKLTVASDNRLDELVAIRNAAGEDTGDVSPDALRRKAVEAAEAELLLAGIARRAFGLPEFPECTDAVALEALYAFLAYMEGKGSPGSARPASPVPSRVAS